MSIDREQLRDDIDSIALVRRLMTEAGIDLIVHREIRDWMPLSARTIIDGLAATIEDHTGIDETRTLDELDRAAVDYVDALRDAHERLDARLRTVAASAADIADAERLADERTQRSEG